MAATLVVRMRSSGSWWCLKIEKALASLASHIGDIHATIASDDSSVASQRLFVVPLPHW